MSNATWLAQVLRDAGLKVVERPGWQTRGRAAMGTVRGVLCHHTGPTSSLEAAIDLIEKGRIGGANPLPGPLSHLMLDVDGTFYVIAAGRCNHAGAGSWHGILDGNGQMIGIEARNRGDGTAWPVYQVAAYEEGCAAILEHIHADPLMVAGHKEYALPKGRKVDPTLDMYEFRDAVAQMMTGAPDIMHASDRNPVLDMLKKGDRGDSVKVLQRALQIREDGEFGPATDKAVKVFQASHGLVADGKVGPKTWAALGVK